MENELKLILVGQPVSLHMLRAVAEQVANEANETHKGYFNGHPVYKIRSDVNAGIHDASTEFCVAMSNALPAAYLYVKVNHAKNRIDRRLVTRASANDDHIETMLDPLDIVTESEGVEHVYLNGLRLSNVELGNELVQPVVAATVPS